MIPFMWNSRKGISIVTESKFGGPGVGGRGSSAKWDRELFWVRELVCIFIVVVVTQLHAVNKNNDSLHLKLVDFVAVSNAFKKKEK